MVLVEGSDCQCHDFAKSKVLVGASECLEFASSRAVRGQIHADGWQVSPGIMTLRVCSQQQQQQGLMQLVPQDVNHFRQFCPDHHFDYWRPEPNNNQQHCSRVCCQPREQCFPPPIGRSLTCVALCSATATCAARQLRSARTGPPPVEVSTYPACARQGRSVQQMRERWCMQAYMRATAMPTRGIWSGWQRVQPGTC